MFLKVFSDSLHCLFPGLVPGPCAELSAAGAASVRCMRRVGRFILKGAPQQVRGTVVVLGLLLTACGSDEADKRLEGKRLSILQLEERLQVDEVLANTTIQLPAPISNSAWPMAGGYPDHSMQHLALSQSLKKRWSSSIGKGDSVLPPPVVYDKTVATVDNYGLVRVFSLSKGKKIFQLDLESEAPGGAIAHAGNQLYVITGDGRLVSISVGQEDVGIKWVKNLPSPPRGGLTVAEGRLFFRISNGDIYAYNASNGDFLWKQEDTPAIASLAQSASIAVSGDLVVAPQSNGDLEAYLARDGRSLWSTTLGGRKSYGLGLAASLVGISGHPVIDGGVVYAVAQSGRLLALEARSGRRLWQLPIGSYNTPWLAGNNIFLLSDQHDLTALSVDGRIRWTKQLPKYKDEDKRQNAFVWYGPVLAGGALWIAGGNEKLIAFDPANGKRIEGWDLPDQAATAPVVANNSLLIVTTDGDLVLYK